MDTIKTKKPVLTVTLGIAVALGLIGMAAAGGLPTIIAPRPLSVTDHQLYSSIANLQATLGGDAADAKNAITADTTAPSGAAGWQATVLNAADPSVAAVQAFVACDATLQDWATLYTNGATLVTRKTPTVRDPDLTSKPDAPSAATTPYLITHQQASDLLQAQQDCLSQYGTVAAMDNALEAARMTAVIPGYETALAGLETALARANDLLSSSQGQVADDATRQALQAAVTAAQTLCDASAGVTDGDSKTAAQVQAATDALNAATATLAAPSDAVTASNVDFTVAQINAMPAGSVVDPTLPADVKDQLFFAQPISDSVFARINGVSFKANGKISRSQLRYVRVLYMGFDGQTHVGELIVNQSIATDIVAIMKQLYANNYPIDKMVLVDNYGADDNKSCADDNTSAFNYRVIGGTSTLSMHAYGLAIDINPLYNPWVTPGSNEPYSDRTKSFPHKIDHSDLAYKLFKQYGFTWGGDWASGPDYQHFEK